ncbi:hypothetical protein FJT64_006727 [Amphibalanus amphitrite]|uniref:Single domain-containing protein n=1 Tax=Amphibalanus amphitrite TaxID=1232801 RepID=A0A6A4VHA6_AMPAM|nr:hypothetical protein FJT64_006727 [Amphibalanus amphitrite]
MFGQPGQTVVSRRRTMSAGRRAALLLTLAALGSQARIQRRCFSQGLERYFQEGSQWTEPTCRRGRCLRGRVVLDDCPPLVDPLPPDCHPAAGQSDAPFPDCCPQLECHQPDQTCYVEELDRHVSVGETWTLPGCGQGTCREGGAVSGKGCGLVGIPPGYPCSLNDGDDSLEYPECCPRVTCPECYSEILDRFFGPGDTWTGPGCTKVKCGVDSATNTVVLSAVPCPLAAPPFPDCELVDGPTSAEYPACCPILRCPDRCFSESLGRWFSKGDEWTEEGCTRARCVDTDQVALLPCGLVAADGPNCRVVPGNASADYPACCVSVECEIDRPCYVEELDRHFAVGETWTLPGCGQATCEQGGAVSGKGCGLIGIPPGYPCSLNDGDDSLEYPECCPRVTCPECYSEILDRFFGPGDTWTGPGCTKVKCGVDSATNTVVLSAVPCPLAAPPFPDCELVDGPTSAEYPACCPTLRCPDRCFSESLGRWFSKGDEWTEEGCTRARCVDTDQVVLLPCGLVAADGPNCRVVPGNASADYPACCVSVECETDRPCYVEELDRHFAVGETWTLPGCGQATCEQGGAVSGKGCGLIRIPPGYPCSVDDGDDSLEYPECCPKVTCRECHSKALDRFFAPGKTWTEPGCIKTKCTLDERGSATMSAVPCPLAAPPFPDCELVDGPTSAEYPACCPTLRCPDRCFSESLGRWFSKGDEWTEEGCTRAFCTGTDQIGMLPCGLRALPRPDCELVSPSAGAEYPQCCPVPRCPGACFSRGLQKLFEIGSSWTDPGCRHLVCIGTDMVVNDEQCELDWIPSGCDVVDGKGDTFPDCCPTIECPDPY